MWPPGRVRSCVRRSSRAPSVVCAVARSVGADAGARSPEAPAAGASAVPSNVSAARAASDRVREVDGM